jgi:hypothetical protein
METLRTTQIGTLLRTLRSSASPQITTRRARLFSSSRVSRQNPVFTSLSSSNKQGPRAWKYQPFRQSNQKAYSTSLSPNPTPNLGSPPASLSQRLRKLSREYGWSALGVYLALSALDFPFCFLAVRWLGTDRIGHWEHVVIQYFWKIVQYPFPEKQGPTLSKETAISPTSDADVALESAPGWGVEAAEEANNSSQASQYLFSY